MRRETGCVIIPAVGRMQTETHSARQPATEPVFNTFRRKPLRPFYSIREFQIGILTGLVLAGVAGWVVWRGRHPDPGLFSSPVVPQKGQTVYKRPVELWVEPGTARAAAPRLDPFPETVVTPGWRVAGPPQLFDESNVYEKIDGRETFYKSYGFQKLHCLSLAGEGVSIDLELFDLGNVQNVLGAFAGEMSEKAEVRADAAGMSYTTRNGGFVAQGRYYARLLGSDDTDAIRTKIAGLRDALIAVLPKETLPWSYALFVGRLKLGPGSVQYTAVDAFSFEFATEIYSAAIPGGELEVFVSKRASVDEAAALTGKLTAGFAGFGKKLSDELTQNEYTHAVDGARAHGVYVTGVRFAKSADEARQWLERLGKELDQMP